MVHGEVTDLRIALSSHIKVDKKRLASSADIDGIASVPVVGARSLIKNRKTTTARSDRECFPRLSIA